MATLCAVAALAVGPEASLARESDFRVDFQATRPATTTTVRLHTVYRDPADPDGKPSPIRRIVIVVPAGTAINVGAVPACDASNQELQLLGPGACPPASQIGTGTLTAITGFGPPIDPYPTRVTIFNDGHGWVEVVQDAQTGATLAVDRFALRGRTFTGNPPATPGGPPDGQTAVRTIDFTFPASRGFFATPLRCPPSRTWVSTAAFTFADGSTQNVESSDPCTAVGGDGGLPRMSLRASPSRVEAGSSRIVFRVDAVRRCRGGATIDFARRRARTDADGRAAIRAHLAPGTYAASATKPGCRRATTTVRVTRDDDD